MSQGVEGVTEQRQPRVCSQRQIGRLGRRPRYAWAVSSRRFPIRLGRRSRPFLLFWGATPSNCYVDLNDEVDAHFGFFSFKVPLANISRWQIEGPWRWITAVGVRASVRGRDITFGGNHRGGVRLDFRIPVRRWRWAIPALYVTVDDMDGFAAALSARGIPGADMRKDGR